MATRSTISVVNDNGSVLSIYCHWDGYLSNNGRILYNHYTDLESVTKLVRAGAISSLGTTTDNTVYYHRDRNESWGSTCGILFSNWEDFVYNHNSEDYDYVFIDGEWYLLNGVSRVDWARGNNILPLSNFKDVKPETEAA